jgi:NAD(P)-dependent dehydrogenase (short-subunit alcohol dehydrogenase family)
MDFTNKVVVITGGANGIGKSTALLFGKENAIVVVSDIDESGQIVVDEIASIGGEALFYKTDISSVNQCQTLIDTTIGKFGKIDILINNAAVYETGDIISTTDEILEKIINVNIKGVFYCCRYTVPYMIKMKKGNIINVGSAGGIVAFKNQIAYSISKSAVIMMSKSLAVDLAPHNIRVNAICPGGTFTPLIDTVIKKSKNPAKTKRAMEKCRPMNRLADPQEIASAIKFLASDDSSFVTGSALVVDGGLTAW